MLLLNTKTLNVHCIDIQKHNLCCHLLYLKITYIPEKNVFNTPLLLSFNSNEPVHEISNNVVCATSKTSDQPAHTHSLIRAFASHLSIL